MLARHVGFDSALLIRGVEGNSSYRLRRENKYFFYHDRGEEQPVEIYPEVLGIEQSVQAVLLPEELPKTTREGDKIAITVDIYFGRLQITIFRWP